LEKNTTFEWPDVPYPDHALTNNPKFGCLNDTLGKIIKNKGGCCLWQRKRSKSRRLMIIDGEFLERER
jgi:hypothetical protein